MGWEKWTEIPMPNMTREEFIAALRSARKHIRFEPLLGEPTIVEFAWEELPPPAGGEADESFTAEAK